MGQEKRKLCLCDGVVLLLLKTNLPQVIDVRYPVQPLKRVGLRALVYFKTEIAIRPSASEIVDRGVARQTELVDIRP